MTTRLPALGIAYEQSKQRRREDLKDDPTLDYELETGVLFDEREDLEGQYRTKKDQDDAASMLLSPYKLEGEPEPDPENKPTPAEERANLEKYYNERNRQIRKAKIAQQLYASQPADVKLKQIQQKKGIQIFPSGAGGTGVTVGQPPEIIKEEHDIDLLTRALRNMNKKLISSGINSEDQALEKVSPSWAKSINEVLGLPLEMLYLVDRAKRSVQTNLSEFIDTTAWPFLKDLMAFGAATIDAPKTAILNNFGSNLGNMTLEEWRDTSNAFDQVNRSSFKFDYDSNLEWGQYKIRNEDGAVTQIVNTRNYIEHHMEKSGVNEVFRDVVKHIAHDRPLTDRERNFFDHAVKYTIEFGTPIAIVPAALSARLAMKLGRGSMEAWFRRETFKKYGLKVPAEMRASDEFIKKEIKRQKGDQQVKLRFGDGTFLTFNRPYNVEKYRRELINWKYLNMALGAGVAGGVTHSFLEAFFPNNFGDYKAMPYVAAMYGMFKGGYGMSRALFKVPFGLAPLTGAGLSVFPPRTIWNYAAGIAAGESKVGRGVQSLMMKTYGAFYTMLRKEGKLTEFDGTTMSAWLTSQASDVDFFRSIKVLIKNFKNPKKGIEELNELSAQQTMPAKSIMHLRDMYLQASEADKQLIEQSVRAAAKLGDDILKTAGPDALGQHSFFLDQIVNLGLLRAQRNTIMKMAKDGQGVLGKISQFKKLTLISEMEAYEKTIQQQIGGILKNVQDLSGDPKNSPLKNFYDKIKKEVDTAVNESQNAQNVFNEFVGDVKGLENGFNRAKLDVLSRTEQKDDGFLIKEYSSDYFLQPHLVQQGEMSATATSKNIENFRGAVNEAIESAWLVMKGESDAIYSKVDFNTLIPADSIVGPMSEEFLLGIGVVKKMLSEANVATQTKDSFITLSKKQALDATTPVKRGDAIVQEEVVTTDEILDDLFELLQAAQTGQIKLKQGGSNIKPEQFAEQLKSLKQTNNREQIIDLASTLRGQDEASIKAVNSAFEPVLTLQQLHSLRMNAWKKVATSTHKDAKWRALKEQAENIDEAISTRSVEARSRDLTALGKSEEEIKKQIKLLQEANENYKENIADVWNNFIGKGLLEANEKMKAVGGLSDEEKLLTLVLNPATDKKGKLLAVNMFNRMFPKGKSEKADKARENVKKLLLHSIAYKIAKEGANAPFIQGLNVDNVKMLVEADILPKTSGSNLATLLLQVQKEAQNASPEVIRASKNLTNAVNRLGEVAQSKIKAALPTQLVDLKVGEKFSTADSIVETLFSDMRASGLRPSKTDLNQQIAVDISDPTPVLTDRGVTTVKQKGLLEAAEDAVIESKRLAEEADIRLLSGDAMSESLKKLRNSAGGDKLDVIDVLRESFGPDDPIWDDILSLGFDYMQRKSWNYTNRRMPWGSWATGVPKIGKERIAVYEHTGVPKLDEFGQQAKNPEGEIIYTKTPNVAELRAAGIDPDLGHIKLQLDIDLPALAENADNMLMLIHKVAAVRGGKYYEEARKHTENVDKILKSSILARGDISAPNLYDVPRRFAAQMLISRLYSLARNVVSPQYLATEAAIREIRYTQAKIVQNILFDPRATKILGKIISRQGTLTKVETKYIASALLKSFGRPEETFDNAVKRLGLRGVVEYIYEELTDELPPALIERERVLAKTRALEAERKRSGTLSALSLARDPNFMRVPDRKGPVDYTTSIPVN